MLEAYRTYRFVKLFLPVIVLLILSCVSCALPQKSVTSSNSKYRADVDPNQLKSYLFNERFLGILRNCLFENGPCDVIGRWVKPRLASALFQTPCESCSELHVNLLHEFLRLLHSRYPNILELAAPTLEKLVLANIQNNTIGSREGSIRNSTGNENLSVSNNGTRSLFVKEYDEQVKKALNEFDSNISSKLNDAVKNHGPMSIHVPILP